MTREEILEAIKDLAKSQGYYGRLLRAIEEDSYMNESIIVGIEVVGAKLYEH